MSLLIKAVSTFLGLTDTPGSYAGEAQKLGRVNVAENAMEFAAAVTQYQIPTNIVPDNATLEYTTGAMGRGRHVRIVGKYAIVASHVPGTPRLNIIDISNPEAPLLLSSTATPSAGTPQDVVVSGNYIFLSTTSPDWIHVWDWSNPRAPVSVVNFNHAGVDDPYGIALRGRYLYVVSQAIDALYIYDISDPANIVNVGNYTSAVNLPTPQAIVLAENYAYVQCNAYLTCINIANPAAPAYVSKLSTCTAGPSKCGIAKVGRYIYIPDCGANRLVIVDVQDPSAMVIVGTKVDNPNLNAVNNLAVVGDWAFCAHAGIPANVAIFDCRNKALPVLQGTITTAQTTNAITLAGKYLFVFGNSVNMFSIYTVWSIDIPAFVGNSIFADYIWCQNIDVAELLNARSGVLNGFPVPETIPMVVSIPLVLTQVVAAAPGAAYVELSALYRTNLDFSRLAVKQARVIVSAIGDEAGAGKGIQIYNQTDGASICEVTWGGNAQQNGLAGAWTACSLRAAKDMRVMVKGSSGTETITVDKVELQLVFS